MKAAKVVLGAALCAGLMVSFVGQSFAQSKPMPSPKASVSQVIGAKNKIEIVYHRPAVKGRDVWHDKSPNAQIGALVPRDGNPRPWRAGANNSTTISFAEDVEIGGKAIPAGDYAIFMIPRDGDWTVIISKAAKGWGSFAYKEEQDAVRVDVTPVEAPHQERLVYGFEDLEDYSCTIFLHWEKVKVPFKVSMKG